MFLPPLFLLLSPYQCCTLLFSLLPFFFSTAVYFYLWTPDSPTSILSAGVKSAPVLLLAAVVLSWNGVQSILGVMGGLLFSAVGDCCLIWPELFLHGKSLVWVKHKLEFSICKLLCNEHSFFFISFTLVISFSLSSPSHTSVSGMGAFAVAHLMYSLTFLSSRYATYSSSTCTCFLYLILFVVGGGFYIYIYPFLQKAPNSDLLIPAVGVYIFLITLMGTLAIRTRHVATLLGSLSFMVSDISLALQVFKVMAPMKHGNNIVMVTYYLAQLLIAVGDVKAVQNKDDFAKWKRS